MPSVRQEFEGTPLFFLREGGKCYAECVENNEVNMCKNVANVKQLKSLLEEYQTIADYWRNKLYDPKCTAKNADILLNKIANIRVKAEEIKNILKEAGVKIACVSKLGGVKNMRKRWHSCYAGKELGAGVGVFVYQDSKHFTVDDKIFELTSGLAGRLLDKMIEHQLCGDKRYIRFNRASRNLFKRLKCVNNKTVNALDYFFTKVVELQLDKANNNKIVGAKLKDDLFGV